MNDSSNASMIMSATDQKEVLQFEIKTEKVHPITDVIRAILFKETATFDVLGKGFRAIVSDIGLCQAVVYFERSIFQSYTRTEDFKFDVPLKYLLDSLSLLDTQGKVLHIKYVKDDVYLDVVHESDGMVVETFDFDTKQIVARVMMRTPLINDIFKELDTTSSFLIIKVDKADISFMTHGDIGKITSIIPAKSVLVDTIDCPAPVQFRYRMSLVRRMSAMLSIAVKVSLRFDTEGVLGAQFIIRPHDTSSTNDGQEIFTEFYCIPDYEESP